MTLNTFALWNSTYIQAAIDQFTREGRSISNADIAPVSPLLFKPIYFFGRYASTSRKPSPKALSFLHDTLILNRTFA